jgi:hypothetical protein
MRCDKVESAPPRRARRAPVIGAGGVVIAAAAGGAGANRWILESGFDLADDSHPDRPAPVSKIRVRSIKYGMSGQRSCAPASTPAKSRRRRARRAAAPAPGIGAAPVMADDANSPAGGRHPRWRQFLIAPTPSLIDLLRDRAPRGDMIERMAGRGHLCGAPNQASVTGCRPSRPRPRMARNRLRGFFGTRPAGRDQCLRPWRYARASTPPRVLLSPMSIYVPCARPRQPVEYPKNPHPAQRHVLPRSERRRQRPWLGDCGRLERETSQPSTFRQLMHGHRPIHH